MNNNVKNELLGMTSEVKKQVSRREKIEKNLKASAKEKFLNDANDNTNKLTIEIIKNIIERYIENTNGLLYRKRANYDYLFYGIRQLNYSYSDFSKLDAIYRYGFDELANDKEFDFNDKTRVLVTWQQASEKVVPAFLDMAFFKNYNLDIQLESREGIIYFVCGTKEDINSLVNDALCSALGKEYKLPLEYCQEKMKELQEICDIYNLINKYKADSRRNADILFLDLIKKMNNDYKEKTSKDINIENEIKIAGTIEDGDVLKLLKKQGSFDIFDKYGYLFDDHGYLYDIRAFKHGTDGNSRLLLVFDEDLKRIRTQMSELFKLVRFNECRGLHFTVNVPVSNFEETILGLSEESKKK